MKVSGGKKKRNNQNDIWSLFELGIFRTPKNRSETVVDILMRHFSQYVTVKYRINQRTQQ